MSNSDVTGKNDRAITELESFDVSNDVSSDVSVEEMMTSL